MIRVISYRLCKPIKVCFLSLLLPKRASRFLAQQVVLNLNSFQSKYTNWQMPFSPNLIIFIFFLY